MDPILVVDDDPSFLSIVTSTFSRLGWPFEVAMTGQDAVMRLRRSTFKAVLLDFQLPDLDAIEVLTRAQLPPGGPPILVISGVGNIRSAVAAVKLGATDFLEKPIAMGALQERIARLTTRHRATPEATVSGEISDLLMAVILAPTDVRTVGEWAALVHLTPVTVFSRCARVGVRAKSALDLSRLLRVALLKPASPADASASLGCLDQRTVTGLLKRVGMTLHELIELDGLTFLRRQTLVSAPDLIHTLASKLVSAQRDKRVHL